MKHIITITKQPSQTGKACFPDGAITGNGDLAVILGSFGGGLRVYLSKADLIYAVENHDKGGARPLGVIDIPVSESRYRNYYVEQDMDKAEIRCRFCDESGETGIRITVPKTENTVIVSFTGNDCPVPALKLTETAADGENGEFTENGLHGIYRHFHGDECAWKNGAEAVIKEIEPRLFCVFTATEQEVNDPRKAVLDKAAQTDAARVDDLYSQHEKGWRDFYAKSSFRLTESESPDINSKEALLELGWYASQYFLAVSAGNPGFPPGLYANFITVEYPFWHSDYHLNYNYQAPFYAACSSNHTELTDCYMAPLKQFIPRGREFAKQFGCRGIILPVGIGPFGLCTEWEENNKYRFLRLFLGQKSNAIHPADIAVFRWNATKDVKYAETEAYPYIKEALAFFEDWCVFENGRYSVPDDAAHEVPFYKTDFTPKKYPYIHDLNNALTLGLLRLTLPAAIEMSEALGVDADRREKWRDMLNKLSPFTTYHRFFRRVFRYTEKGQAWHGDNDVGMQHLYPGNAIKDFSEKEKKTALNTFNMRKYCYTDGNAVSSYFPIAARLKIDPETVLSKLDDLNRYHRMDNGLYGFEGGGLEYSSIHAATLNEMVMQSFRDGLIELFPCWNIDRFVSFRDLLADGAVLVSSGTKDGKAVKTELECLIPRDKLEITLPPAKNGYKTEITAPGNICVNDPEAETQKDGRVKMTFSCLPEGTKIIISAK